MFISLLADYIKKIQSLQYVKLYIESYEFNFHIELILAFPFVPHDHVINFKWFIEFYFKREKAKI